MKRATLAGLIIGLAVIVESLLVLRAWWQATAKPIDSSAAESLYAITRDLAAPFVLFTGEAARNETGVIDFTILVAIEGYFVAALALLALTYLVGRAISLDFWRASNVSDEEPTLANTRLWQPQRCTRLPGARLYVPLTRRYAGGRGNAAFSQHRRATGGP
jgi:hypothetical protein